MWPVAVKEKKLERQQFFSESWGNLHCFLRKDLKTLDFLVRKKILQILEYFCGDETIFFFRKIEFLRKIF